VITEVHDWAMVFINGKAVGSWIEEGVITRLKFLQLLPEHNWTSWWKPLAG
jgi:hypothetical protein